MNLDGVVYVIIKEYDYSNSDILKVSSSLQECVDAVNKAQEFPYMGDRVIVQAWRLGTLVATSETFGNRDVWNDDLDLYQEHPFTLDEFTNNMKEAK